MVDISPKGFSNPDATRAFNSVANSSTGFIVCIGDMLFKFLVSYTVIDKKQLQNRLLKVIIFFVIPNYLTDNKFLLAKFLSVNIRNTPVIRLLFFLIFPRRRTAVL